MYTTIRFSLSSTQHGKKVKWAGFNTAAEVLAPTGNRKLTRTRFSQLRQNKNITVEKYGELSGRGSANALFIKDDF
ncbi:hypothetical protein L345_02022, partial [Ophiophagus hannah]